MENNDDSKETNINKEQEQPSSSEAPRAQTPDEIEVTPPVVAPDEVAIAPLESEVTAPAPIIEQPSPETPAPVAKQPEIVASVEVPVEAEVLAPAAEIPAEIEAPAPVEAEAEVPAPSPDEIAQQFIAPAEPNIPTPQIDESASAESSIPESVDTEAPAPENPPEPEVGSTTSSAPAASIVEEAPIKKDSALVKMEKAKSLIKKNVGKKTNSEKALKKTKTLSEVKNWYKDRYQSVVIQRNVLFFVTALALFGLGFAVTAVATLNASKIFEPFVIEVEEKTGVVTQIDHKKIEKYTANQAVQKYFISKYLKARENYNFADYRYYYYTVARVLSSGSVYGEFRGYISSDPNSPLVLARSATKEIKIKSMSYLEEKKLLIRVLINTYIAGTKTIKSQDHRVITLNFDFFTLSLSREERYINPLGFQITSYRVDEDNLQ